MGRSTPIRPRKRLSAEQRASQPSLEARVSQVARELEEQASRMAPGLQRDALLKRARLMDTANHISDWLSSPGLQPPK